MKKVIALILAAVTIVSSFTTAFAATENISSKQVTLPSQAQVNMNPKALNALKEHNIEVIVTSDNRVELKNKDINTIESANMVLSSLAVTYPTAWITLTNYSYITSKLFRDATETAFYSTLMLWLVGGIYLPAVLAKSAAAEFGTYYFVNRSEERIYYSKNYKLRELSAGHFDSMGNFIGDYQIMKTERTTLNSNGTGGQGHTSYEFTTVMVPSI